MAIPRVGEVLFSRPPLQIVARPEGQIHGIVSDALSVREVAVQGIPRHIDLLDRQEVSEAKSALLTCRIEFDSFQIQVMPKLKGGGPPLVPDLIRMGNFRIYQFNDTELLTDSFKQQFFSQVVPVAGAAIIAGAVPPIGIAFGLTYICGTLLNFYRNSRNRARFTELEGRIRELETRLNQGGTVAKQGYDVFVTFLHGFLADPAERRTVVGNLFNTITTKKQEITDQPQNPQRQIELKGLLDCVHLVSAAIPDKTIASRVVKVGEASLAFAQAFLMVRQMGGIAAAGLTGMLGPVGLALAGISTLASLIFQDDEDPEITGQIHGLTGQAAQLQEMIGLRFDRLEALVADLDRRMFEEFRQLHAEIADLRRFCEQHSRVVNLKLDRIRGFLAQGFTALGNLSYYQIKADAAQRLQLTTQRHLTLEEHRNLLISFGSWAHVQAKNGVFTGELNRSYAVEDIATVLNDNVPENLLRYLSHYPYYQPRSGIELNLANPYVWADAAEAYMQVQLFSPQFDRAYRDHHLPLFLNIYRTGRELQDFISDVQTNRDLFDGLLAEYEDHLADIGSGQVDPHTLAHFDSAYHLLIAYSSLAFQRSSRLDLIFASFINTLGNPRLRLVTSQEIQALMQTANQAPSEQRNHLRAEIFADLHRSLQYFRGVLHQKIAEARDSHALVTTTMQRLWDFGSRYFPNAPDFAPNTYPATADLHFTDVNRILQDDIFFAVFMGNLPAVNRLIGNHSTTDTLGRTPLHYACSTGQLNIVQRLVEAGANFNAIGEGGVTPVILARRHQRNEVENFLRTLGAAPYYTGEPEYQEALRHTLSSGPFYPRSWPYDRQPYWGRIFPPLQKAAEAGHAEAQYRLGHYLSQSRQHGNLQSAYSWFSKAAAQGHAASKDAIDHINKHGLLRKR